MPFSTRTGSGRPERTAFFISDGTGITAETFGCSMLSQFDDLSTRHVRLPFIDSEDKAHEAVARINSLGASDGQRPLVFSTLANPAISKIVQTADAMYLDLIGHIHASEKDLVALGDGSVPHAAMGAAIRRHLPDALVCVEILKPRSGPWQDGVARSLTLARRCYG